MRRGDIYRANLEPIIGHEANKTNRPVVIVSTNAHNTRAAINNDGLVTVVPTTTKYLDYPAITHVILRAAESPVELDSKAQIEQIRSVDISRLTPRALGNLSARQMHSVDRALRNYLDL